MNKEREISILYVDDEEYNLYLFELSFEEKYSILTAISGEDGLQKLDSHHNRIIVVISDMRMPRMDGLEFISKAKEKYDHIYYFILTGYDFNDEINEAVESQLIRKSFSKPLDKEQIDSAIQEVIAAG